MTDFLDNIIAYKKTVVNKKKPFYEMIKKRIGNGSFNKYGIFKNIISRQDRINLIAEIKKASPSKGLIINDFDPLKIAKIYQQNKVDAISVLTEDKYFLGDPKYIKKISDKVEVPILAKDFFIDEGQIYEARYNGASAILLIAVCLSDKRLKDFIKIAFDLDVDCLVEVHDEKDLDRALDCGSKIIGINNRDLRSFKIDLSVTEKLIKKIPKDKIVVSESGIKSKDDITKFKSLGVNAVLIGETFMAANDIGNKIKEIFN